MRLTEAPKQASPKDTLVVPWLYRLFRKRLIGALVCNIAIVHRTKFQKSRIRLVQAKPTSSSHSSVIGVLALSGTVASIGNADVLVRILSPVCLRAGIWRRGLSGRYEKTLQKWSQVYFKTVCHLDRRCSHSKDWPRQAWRKSWMHP